MVMAPCPEKTCSKCKAVYPMAQFRRDKKASDGLHSWCRGCERLAAREYGRKHAEEKREYARLRYHAVNKHDPAYVAANRARSSEWRERNPLADRRYRAQHRVRINAQRRERYPLIAPKVRAMVAEQRRRSFAANPERCRLLGRERAAVRRARIKGQSVGTVRFNDVLRRDGWLCHLCGGFVTRETLSFDHVVPLAKGGAHAVDNLKVAHLACNRVKGARLIEDSAGVGLLGKRVPPA